MSVFESVFSNIASFVYRSRSDGDCELVAVYGGVYDLLGYTVEEVMENPHISFMNLTVPEDRAETFQLVDEAVEKGEAWDIIYRMLHKSGEKVWVRENGKAVYENGKLTFLEGLIVGAQVEISARFELEKLVQETNASNREIIKLTENITTSIRTLKMLSVNARIEAARSGEAGVGFMAVADEMKKLAEQNAKWAQVIRQKINTLS